MVQNGDYKSTADLVYGYIQILGESALKMSQENPSSLLYNSIMCQNIVS